MNDRARSTDPELPLPPERPDCCFGGCAQCVLDDYTDAMARWQAEVDEILRRRAQRRNADAQGTRTPIPAPRR